MGPGQVLMAVNGTEEVYILEPTTFATPCLLPKQKNRKATRYHCATRWLDVSSGFTNWGFVGHSRLTIGSPYWRNRGKCGANFGRTIYEDIALGW